MGPRIAIVVSLSVTAWLGACAGDAPQNGGDDDVGAPDAGPGADAALTGADSGHDPVDEFLATLPASCTVRPAVKPDCAALGATFDPETRYCRDGNEAVGLFSPALRATCTALQGGQACNGNRWNRAFFLDVLDRTDLRDVPIDEVFASIWARGDVTCQPTAQDKEGNGIFQVPSGAVPASARSEAVYPPFVLGPRRQVDALVRQLYLALPDPVRAETAFVVADRLVQNPEAYVRYLRSRKRVVIAGSFVGIGQATSLPAWAAERHASELWKLRVSIALVHALGRDVADVVYAMGDSPSTFGLTVRTTLNQRFRRTLEAAGLAAIESTVGWGADETMTVAMARSLPKITVRFHLANPAALQHYDGERRTDEIVAERAPQVGVTIVDGPADLEVAVFGRRPGGGNADWQAGDSAQATFDDSFAAELATLPAGKLVIVDARLFNGAWDARSALKRCDLAGFGSWGTFGNVLGSTLAAAKISRGAPAGVRRQLYLEAVAHDVFANGYAEAQRAGLKTRIDNMLGAGTYKHFAGYTTSALTAQVFAIVNGWVNERMAAHFAGTGCMNGRSVRVTPQLWRTFESEVHLLEPAPGELFVPGVYRADLPAATFDPRAGHDAHLTVADLEAGR